jgi:Fe-S-cluster containining protein
MPAKPIDPDRLQTAMETRFHCLQCGNCCKGPGLVHIGEEETQRLADFMQLDAETFRQRFAKERPGGDWVLIDKQVAVRGSRQKELWCIFLEQLPDGKFICQVNPAKPDQCASFPAAWRNWDSMKSCAGLRAMVAELRNEDAQATQEEPRKISK